MSIVLIIAGVVCVIYGAFVMGAWTGSSFFAVWLALGVVLAGCGILMHNGAWARLPQALRWGAGAAGVVALLVVGALSALVMGTAVAEPPAGLDRIVVLGAQVRADGSPSASLAYRLETARDYLAENPSTKVVVSGGQGPNEPCSEAEAMARWFEDNGVDPSRITLEDRSTSTVENLRFTRELLGADATGSVGVVTNDFHVFRAVRIARRQGLGEAVGIAAPSVPAYLPNNVLRECLGVAKDLLAGNMGL